MAPYWAYIGIWIYVRGMTEELRAGCFSICPCGATWKIELENFLSVIFSVLLLLQLEYLRIHWTQFKSWVYHLRARHKLLPFKLLAMRRECSHVKSQILSEIILNKEMQIYFCLAALLLPIIMFSCSILLSPTSFSYFFLFCSVIC